MSAPAPPSPRVERLPDEDALAAAAAEAFVGLAQAAIAEHGVFRVAMTGGSTPRLFYHRLAEAPWSARVDWPRVEFYWGDERAVPPDHPDSNYGMARDALLAPAGIAPSQTHRMPAEREDLDAAARDYAEELARGFGIDPAGPPPRFDLLLLGMGPDGHVASLFPGTAALSERRLWVLAHRVPKLGADRMTLTYPVLNAAREVLFLVAGEAKAKALAEVLEGPADPERLPAQGVRPATAATWLVDAAAAALLQRPSTAGGSPPPPPRSR